MPKLNEWTKIYVGHLSADQVANIAREIKYLWRYTEKVYPDGDRTKVAQIKATKDKFGQYYFYLNQQALRLILLSIQDVKELLPLGKQATTQALCPQEVPDFLRWDTHSDSKPE